MNGRRVVAGLVVLLSLLSGCQAVLPAVPTEPVVSVYGAAGEQAAVYRQLAAQNNFSSSQGPRTELGYLVQESITPFFRIDLETYDRTGEWKLVPYATRVYAANAVAENGAFLGVQYLVMKPDGQVRTASCRAVTDAENPPASCAYADHAEWIRQALQSTEPILPEQVRLVFQQYLGFAFDVQWNGNEYLIPLRAELRLQPKPAVYQVGGPELRTLAILPILSCASRYV